MTKPLASTADVRDKSDANAPLKALYGRFREDLRRRQHAIRNATNNTDTADESFKGDFIDEKEAGFREANTMMEWITLKRRQWGLTYFYAYEPTEKWFMYFVLLSLLGLVVYYYL